MLVGNRFGVSPTAATQRHNRLLGIAQYAGAVHPNPSKAEKCVTKTRLEPDGVRTETVTLIAKWRYYEQLGFDTIAERLNQDLDKYPQPEPPGGLRARGAWSKSSVGQFVEEPQVHRLPGLQPSRPPQPRRAEQTEPAADVVWSAEPAHEPLIPKWMFDEFNARSTARRAPATAPG